MLNKHYKVLGDIVLPPIIISTIIGEGIVKHLARCVRPYNSENEIKLSIGKLKTYSFPQGIHYLLLLSDAIAGIMSGLLC